MTKIADKIKINILCSIIYFLENRSCLLWECGKILWSGAGHIWQYGASALHAGYLRLQTYNQKMLYSLFFHCNNGCTNALEVTLYVHCLSCLKLNLSAHTVNLLTPRSKVLLEKLTGSAASQEIPRIFGTRRFLTVPTSAHHLSLSWANSIQSPQLPPTSWRSILILSSYLRLCLPNGLFPSDFPIRTLCTPLPLPHTRHMPRPSHSSRFYHPHNILQNTSYIIYYILKASSLKVRLIIIFQP